VPLGETPCASAWLIDVPETISHYGSVCAFFDWADALPDDLPDAEADERYERERITCGIDIALLDAYWHGWSILLSEGERRAKALRAGAERQQPTQVRAGWLRDWALVTSQATPRVFVTVLAPRNAAALQ
jgi:hypothetical protein